MIAKVKKHILTSIIAGALIYLALSIYADYNAVLSSVKYFGIVLLPLLLLLSYLNYLTRFLKWHYYLRLLRIGIEVYDSFLIFMSGLIMSVTPGKVGELLKSYMLKQIANEPISKTAPIVLAERMTDFISLLFLAIIGSYVYGAGEIIIIGTAGFFVLLLLILSNRSLAEPLFKLIANVKFLKKYIPKAEEAYDSVQIMLRPKPLILMCLLSLVSWFFECFGFYLILTKFNVNISLLWASFTYAFSTILGSITMLPGGLGVTDGSMTFFMIEHGISKDISVTSTFIIRLVTLWFAVFVGMISVFLFRRKFGNYKEISH